MASHVATLIGVNEALLAAAFVPYFSFFNLLWASKIVYLSVKMRQHLK